MEILSYSFIALLYFFFIGFILSSSLTEEQPIENTNYYVCGKIISYSENGDEIYLSFNGFEQFDFNEVKEIQGFRIEKIINSTEIVTYVERPFNQQLKLAELFNYFEKQYCVD